ncbi:hypothetical protein PoB_004911600 [Plakobranchus ocellatus]|uniref:PH domain-containing protein n=1 Tax=Plakobranchus ocellatus TaxID=259542 RepID=A0AAV4BQ72_9GAST|nr:hypothetical protein PoB_004911600 [Plakobranchus ocellatus]
MQRGDESIEEWADKIHHLAHNAFQQESGAGFKHEKDKMIMRFCTGCTDRAGGFHGANIHPERPRAYHLNGPPRGFVPIHRNGRHSPGENKTPPRKSQEWRYSMSPSIPRGDGHERSSLKGLHDLVASLEDRVRAEMVNERQQLESRLSDKMDHLDPTVGMLEASRRSPSPHRRALHGVLLQRYSRAVHGVTGSEWSVRVKLNDRRQTAVLMACHGCGTATVCGGTNQEICSFRDHKKRPWVGTSALLTTLALTGRHVCCDRAYAQVMTDSSEDQYKTVQVLLHPHDLGYPLGYGNSFRCYASSYHVVNTNGLDPPRAMDSAPDYATSHQVVNPNGQDLTRGVDSVLAPPAPAFREPEFSQPFFICTLLPGCEIQTDWIHPVMWIQHWRILLLLSVSQSPQL